MTLSLSFLLLMFAIPMAAWATFQLHLPAHLAGLLFRLSDWIYSWGWALKTAQGSYEQVHAARTRMHRNLDVKVEMEDIDLNRPVKQDIEWSVRQAYKQLELDLSTGASLTDIVGTSR